MLYDQVISKICAALSRLVVVAVVIVLMSLQHASAAPLTIQVETLTAAGPGTPVSLTPTALPLPDGSFNYEGQYTIAGSTMSWIFNADPDPHYTTWDGRRFDFQGLGVFQNVINNRSVELTNTSAALTSYMVSFNVPGGSASPAHMVSAGVAATVEDGELGNHEMGHSLMTVMTDGTPHLRFFENDFTNDGTSFLVDDTAPQLDSTPIHDGFAMQLAFSLTPGATAYLIPQFEATPVPEPATGLLLIVGLTSMLVVRRR